MLKSHITTKTGDTPRSMKVKIKCMKKSLGNNIRQDKGRRIMKKEIKNIAITTKTKIAQTTKFITDIKKTKYSFRLNRINL